MKTRARAASVGVRSGDQRDRVAGVVVSENSARRMPQKTVKPTRAVKNGQSAVGLDDQRESRTGKHTVKVLETPVKGPESKNGKGKCTVERSEVDHDQQRAEYHHGTLKKVDESPLRLIIDIDHTDGPCRS